MLPEGDIRTYETLTHFTADLNRLHRAERRRFSRAVQEDFNPELRAAAGYDPDCASRPFDLLEELGDAHPLPLAFWQTLATAAEQMRLDRSAA